jgi:hypothetical protein
MWMEPLSDVYLWRAVPKSSLNTPSILAFYQGAEFKNKEYSWLHAQS